MSVVWLQLQDEPRRSASVLLRHVVRQSLPIPGVSIDHPASAHKACSPTLTSPQDIMGQTTSQSVSSTPPAQCPINHTAPSSSSSSASAKCPVPHDKPSSSISSPSQAPAQCPISHDALNPLNQMPTLSQMPAAHQAAALPVERETSSIPRDDSSKWDYPSPQQFYNALVRKGWETPEEHVETMVQIHNFLNEQAWQEILKWERKENP